LKYGQAIQPGVPKRVPNQRHFRSRGGLSTGWRFSPFPARPVRQIQLQRLCSPRRPARSTKSSNRRLR